MAGAIFLAAFLVGAVVNLVSPDTGSGIARTTVQPAPPTSTADAAQSAASAAGIPPRPDAATTNAYIYALEQIDPDIVHGKPDKAVDRGRSQCSSIRQHPNDGPKLIELTQVRFTSPDHPGGFDPEVAAQILSIVRQHICPTY